MTAALTGRPASVPTARTRPMEAVRALRVARRGAIAARADAQTQLKALVVTTSEPLRGQLRGLSARELVVACAALTPELDLIDDPVRAVKSALRALARRHLQLSTEIADLDVQLGPLVESMNPANDVTG